MARYYVFNGDADGLCAVQQLRLSERTGGTTPPEATLITGVKRDIELLDRVPLPPDQGALDVTVLDVSLDKNRGALLRLLEAGAHVRYFDHHHAGDIPEHPRLEVHIDLSPSVCTSLLVDRALEGRYRTWAISAKEKSPTQNRL